MSLSKSTVRVAIATTLAAALLATSGCSVFHRKDGSMRFLPHRHNSDYSKSRENRPLEVPPDLDTPATDPAMQIPSTRSATAAPAAMAPATAAFTVSDTVAGAWERIGRALERIDGVAITQRAQLLNSYEITYKGATLLIRASSDGTTTRIDTVGTDGQQIRTPEALEVLSQLRARVG